MVRPRGGVLKLSEPLIWIDLEMSGLDADRHVILEIASVVTTDQLEILAEGPDLAVHYDDDTLGGMEAWSREHHTASGLLDRVRRSTLDCGTAEEQTLAFLAAYCQEGRSPLCGNSVWQDRRFLHRHMPRLEGFFHYRNIDVSSIKELVRRWYPSLPGFDKAKTHLALKDIQESIAELKYYRRHVFVDPAVYA